MTGSAETGSDAMWIAALSAGDGVAVDRLHGLVRDRLGRVLGSRRGLTAADLDDFAQDACLRILASLDSFRGDARFTTWSMAIAVRVAMTALRRRRWTRERVASQFQAFTEPVAPADAPERDVVADELFDLLRAAIDSNLTARQRQVMLAELSGIPQIMIAEQLGAAPNAIYKVAHDARRKIRGALEARGFDAQTVRRILDGASMENR